MYKRDPVETTFRGQERALDLAGPGRPDDQEVKRSSLVAETVPFRAALRKLAGGVVVVTVGRDQYITGFTATSVSSLSVQPPRLLVCVNQASASWVALQRHPHFTVNILRDVDEWVADRFAGRDGLEGAERYRDVSWTQSPSGTPQLDTALARLDCDIEETLPRYDHVIVIGQVREALIRPDSLPLVYWQGKYHPL
jgi:flavin reductase (DIM6/NTAB) family NADH-FMN oxidoreductase RutF